MFPAYTLRVTIIPYGVNTKINVAFLRGTPFKSPTEIIKTKNEKKPVYTNKRSRKKRRNVGKLPVQIILSNYLYRRVVSFRLCIYTDKSLDRQLTLR